VDLRELSRGIRLVDVRERHQLDVGLLDEAIEKLGPPVADADETHSNALARRGGAAGEGDAGGGQGGGLQELAAGCAHGLLSYAADAMSGIPGVSRAKGC
jgi:hypothetical protein